MPQPVPSKSNLRPTGLALLTLALACAVFLTFADAGQAANKRVAKAAPNPTLGKTVLVTTGGRTLYSLSAETNGKFICTATCLTVWRPLTVTAAVTPLGPVKLGTIERPEGQTQVTFKGKPLYTFSGDTKPGQANGEGIKDVGTWHAASTGKLPPQPAPEPQPQPTYPY